MKYMYTTTPDEGCREFSKGIYGRPVHTSHQSSLRKQGWVYSVNDIEVTHVRQEEAEVEECMDFDEYLRRKYQDVFGKNPHHKMKRETMQAKIAEAEADGGH